ncbi:hypothetical protein [Flavobacterium sp. MDT1-60]|uniref:hypothetical protein n=1 Tax=Flavobacterium sp. MDT1-60 TaxID=1979344 RepID=UPI0017833A88|nr:hypothetical protein [Flavobacterium sp. MDT1-60]QOG04270.1 hypothetical protein IHE43_08715 [Flavobacterium sp. MDT1-60]
MLNSLNKNQLYVSISISFLLFIIFNFIIGPSSVFGLAEFIQNKTGYFFGVGINTLDYFLISLIPFIGLLINSKRKIHSWIEILKVYLTILLSCIGTFSVGLCFLISKIGSASENPLIPQYLRVEPFKGYSSFLIALGIVLAFSLVKNGVKETENRIEEIGMKNE